MATCKAKTTRGTRCKREAGDGSDFCYQHGDTKPSRKTKRGKKKWVGAAAAAATAIAAVTVGVSEIKKRKGTGGKKKKKKAKKKRGRK